MAKIYFNRYMARVKRGEITLAEAVELAKVEVPERWRDEVVAMLEAVNE